jgi:hypothetical protein
MVEIKNTGLAFFNIECLSNTTVFQMMYKGIPQNDLEDYDIDSCSEINKIMRVFHHFLFPPMSGRLHSLQLESLTDIATNDDECDYRLVIKYFSKQFKGMLEEHLKSIHCNMQVIEGMVSCSYYAPQI